MEQMYTGDLGTRYLYVVLVVSWHWMQIQAQTDPVEEVLGLKMALVVFRHGDRSALYSYPTDPHGEKIWPNGFAQLTTRGIQQEFNLGQFIRKRYNALLDSPIISNQVLLQSSGLARTLKSAAAFAAGFDPPTPELAWNAADLGSLWQPTAIFSRSVERDAIFGVSPCPRWVHLKNSVKLLPEAAALQLKYTNLTNYVMNHTQMRTFNFPRSYRALYDILYTQSQNGYRLPDWATPDVLSDIKYMADTVFHMSAGGNDRADRIRPRIRGGNMLRVIMEELARRVNGTTAGAQANTRLYLYSAHDENIGALLTALHLYDFDVEKGISSEMPNYASCLMFELFLNNTVRISFKNDRPDTPDTNPIVLIHPNCSTFCPLDELVNLTSPYFMDEEEWFEACKLALVDGAASPTTGHNQDADETGNAYFLHVLIGCAFLLSIVAGLIALGVVLSIRKQTQRNASVSSMLKPNLPRPGNETFLPGKNRS